jgi:predicted oxidoreductase
MSALPRAPVLRHKSGMSMPSLALGTWRTDNGLLYEAVREAIRVGYRHLDCAPIYQNQHIIGSAIADAISAGEVTRAELFIVSKLASTECDPEHVMPALQQTLKDLQTDYLDLYLIVCGRTRICITAHQAGSHSTPLCSTGRNGTSTTPPSFRCLWMSGLDTRASANPYSLFGCTTFSICLQS